MDIKKKVAISWSGGKDSAFALYKILLSGEYEVASLHTVINEETKRVGMHGVREEMIDQQAEALGLPVTKIYLESTENHEAYKKLMTTFYRQLSDEHIYGIVFGDIFLEDLKEFRKSLLIPFHLEGIFPLWKLHTHELIQEFIDSKFKTLICCADAHHFTEQQTGKTIDGEFIQNLSSHIDPCGERGEFHTFVYDGPIFKQPIGFQFGEVVKKTYQFQKKNEDGAMEEIESAFWFQDLLPLMA